jgi:hypothetical protein
MTPRAPEGDAPEAALGRMSLDKVYRGDLEATARGEMLTAMSGVEGSGAYVAVEVVRGALGGRRGSFALQHRGVMARGVPDLAIAVVPDSGTEGLVGISGRLGIEIRDGEHFYELEYELPSEK